jgi:hypothetical protein
MMKYLLVLAVAFAMGCEDKEKKPVEVKPPPVVTPTPIPVLTGVWAFSGIVEGLCEAAPKNPCVVGKEQSAKVGGNCMIAKCVLEAQVKDCVYQTESGTDFSPSRVGSKCNPIGHDPYYICYCKPK